ncbi:copper(I)-binding protein [Nitrobacteraceae bacterium AZCC 2146]
MAVASARPRSSRLWSAGFSLVALGLGIGPALGAGETLQVTKAWVSPVDQVGIDVPLLMTITNDAAEADALLRVRCPFANFTEKHIVDRGEGSPAMRSIPSIPIPPNKATVLKPDNYHVMLLQTRQRLVDGERLTCSVVFQKAGTKEMEVLVSRAP